MMPDRLDTTVKIKVNNSDSCNCCCCPKKVAMKRPKRTMERSNISRPNIQTEQKVTSVAKETLPK